MDGYVTIGTELDTSPFDAQIEYVKKRLEEIEYQLKQADMGFEVGDTLKLEAEYEKLSNRLNTLIKKKEEFNKTDFSGVKGAIDNVGKSVEKVTKKVGHWALAVFGIRSAYLFVRQAMSALTQYDDQLASNVEYIRYALANALAPVIEWIINLVVKLLTYINYISQAWFGINLFANSSAKAFKNAKDNLSKSAKSAKELKKQLASFDEMNVLQDPSSSGGDTTVAPSFDLSNMDIEIPGWIQWIADNGELIAGVITGITTALVLMKLLGLDPIMALGIGAIVGGIVMLVKDLIDFISDPSWENFAAVLGDIAVIIGGIMLVTGNWWGLLVVILGLLVKLVAENWETISNILGQIGGWIYNNIIKPVGDFFTSLWNAIVKGVKNAFSSIKNVFSSIVSFFSGIVNSILNLFRTIGTNVGNVIASAFKGVVNGVLRAIESILNAPINAINGLISVINAVPGINIGKLRKFSLPRLAKGGIVNMPGSGVMVGGAIAGERGREGVIPLTDSQQMAMLGEAIGRYITIDLTNITNLDGRQIARKVEQISQNNKFVLNR